MKSNLPLFLNNSVVEQLTVNLLVVGWNPTIVKLTKKTPKSDHMKLMSSNR